MGRSRTGARHPTSVVVGVTYGLDIEGVRFFPQVAVGDTGHVGSQRLLVFHRNSVEGAAQIVERRVATELEARCVRQPTGGVVQLEFQV